VLVFDGRLDNRDELLDTFRTSSAVSSASSDPVLILAAYEAYGQRFPEHLNGDFSLALFDPRRQELILARDAIGARPLYYCRTGNTLLFASEIKAILAHPGVPRRCEEDFLAAYLLCGAGPQDARTCFAGVLRLLPAHVAVFSDQRSVVQRYWDFDIRRQVRLASVHEYAEAFREHFTTSVRRRTRSAHPVAVSLSGGLDSSSIFCVAETLQQPRVFGISMTPPEAAPPGSPMDEVTFLIEIEKQYGSRIERVPQSGGYLDRCEEAIFHVEVPRIMARWDYYSKFLQTARRGGARVLLSGVFGDQITFNQEYLIDLARRLQWGKVRAHLQEFPRWFENAEMGAFRRFLFHDLVRYPVPDFLVPPFRALRSSLAREGPGPSWYASAFRERARVYAAHRPVVRLPGASAYARALYLQATSLFHVMAMEFSNQMSAAEGLEIAFPFMDRDLLSFCLAIPGEVMAWEGVPKGLLRRAMKGTLPEAIAERRSKADFTDSIRDAMLDDYPKLQRYLESGVAVEFGFLKGRGVIPQMEGGAVPPGDWPAFRRLYELLGLELWLQAFFVKKG
jgi:asparagine synthase (glutamine-hydrolysing)